MKEYVAAFNSVGAQSIRGYLEKYRDSAANGTLPYFDLGCAVSVEREGLAVGVEPTFHWCGSKRIFDVCNNYVFEVKDIRNGSCEDVHGICLKYYRDECWDTN